MWDLVGNPGDRFSHNEAHFDSNMKKGSKSNNVYMRRQKIAPLCTHFRFLGINYCLFAHGYVSYGFNGEIFYDNVVLEY